MRSKVLVPIGQGCICCRPGKHDNVEYIEWLIKSKRIDRCEEHFWLYLNHCLGCGEKFHSRLPHSKTCSDKCRKRLSRMRHEKLFQTVMKFAEGVE